MAKNQSVKMESIKYIKLTSMRFIGKDVVAKGKKDAKKYGEMWDKRGEFLPILDAMASYLTDITDPCALIHHENAEVNKKNPMHYMVGKFMKANTPVPEGFDYWDIPETSAAMAIVQGEFADMIKKTYYMVRDKILADGLKIPYPKGYFHAEVYIKDNIPEEGVISKLGYLFSCCSEQERKELPGQEAYPS